jgi:hypothetical protein
MSERWQVAVDFGQVHDYSALAAVAQVLVGRRWEHHVRSLKRWPLGTSYVAVADDLARIIAREPLWGCNLVCDATGVGRPCIDMLRDRHLPCQVIPCTISGGAHSSCDVNGWSVSKRELVSVVMVLLGQARLWIAAGLELGPTLQGEFENFRAKVTASGGKQLEVPWRQGQNDDLLLSVALACWYGERRPPAMEQDPCILVPGRVDPAAGEDWGPAFVGKVGALGDWTPQGEPERRPPILGGY